MKVEEVKIDIMKIMLKGGEFSTIVNKIMMENEKKMEEYKAQKKKLEKIETELEVLDVFLQAIAELHSELSE